MITTKHVILKWGIDSKSNSGFQIGVDVMNTIRCYIYARILNVITSDWDLGRGQVT